MNQRCITCLNGGSNYLVKVKEKIKREFILQLQNLQQIYIHFGQYIQEGRRNLFETVINIKNSSSDLTINHDGDDLDGLNYIEGKSLDYVNKKAMEGTIEAHVAGDVPNIIIDMDVLDEETLGHLIYFFELSCAMSGKILGVNPFNQPGVEKYKANMFKLLGKPGY